MSAMKDLSERLLTAFDENAQASLDAMLAATQARAFELQREVTGVLDGSTQEAAGVVQEGLIRITELLGEAVVGLAVVNGAKETLLSRWGIAGHTEEADMPAPGFPVVPMPSTLGQQIREQLADPGPRNYLDPAMQQKLTVSLEDAAREIADNPGQMTPHQKGAATQARWALEKMDVVTARDVLVVGQARLTGASAMSASKVAAFKQVMRHACPDIDIPERPDAAFAATVCPSIKDIPWSALVDEPDRWAHAVYGTPKTTVQDVLTRPREHLVGGKLSQENYEKLRQLAQDYAAAFQAAKQTGIH